MRHCFVCHLPSQDCLYRIAETFNKEFEEVARLKQAEIARIREKNVRILKIIHQLQLEEELVQPTLYPEEQPEEMLIVQVSRQLSCHQAVYCFKTHTHITILDAY